MLCVYVCVLLCVYVCVSHLVRSVGVWWWCRRSVSASGAWRRPPHSLTAGPRQPRLPWKQDTTQHRRLNTLAHTKHSHTLESCYVKECSASVSTFNVWRVWRNRPHSTHRPHTGAWQPYINSHMQLTLGVKQVVKHLSGIDRVVERALQKWVNIRQRSDLMYGTAFRWGQVEFLRRKPITNSSQINKLLLISVINLTNTWS